MRVGRAVARAQQADRDRDRVLERPHLEIGQRHVTERETVEQRIAHPLAHQRQRQFRARHLRHQPRHQPGAAERLPGQPAEGDGAVIADQRVAGEFLQPETLARQQPMPARQHADHIRLGQRGDLEVVVLHRQHRDRQIRLPRHQLMRHVGKRRRAVADLHARVAAQIGGDHAGDEAQREAGARADRQLARAAPPEILGEALDLLRHLVQPRHLVEQKMRLAGRHQLAATAVEEPIAQPLLAQRDRPADGRLRDVQDGRGGIHRPRQHHRPEDFQLSDSKCHFSII